MSSHSVAQFAPTRKERAEQLLASHAVSPNGGHGRYYVRSQADDSKTYLVDLQINTCTCPDHTYNRAICKHLQAAHLFEQQQETETVARTHRLGSVTFYRLDEGYDCEACCACGETLFGFSTGSRDSAYRHMVERHSEHVRLCHEHVTRNPANTL